MKQIKIKGIQGDKSGLKLYAVVPSSSSDRAHTVVKRTLVRRITIWTCTCEGYAFRGTCKHIQKVKDQI